jgi:hypothetical protein
MKPTRIELGFGVALLLLTGMLLGTGWFTLSHRAKVDSQLSDKMEGQWTKVQLANDALRISSRNNRITMQIFLLKRPQDIAPLLAERAKNSDAISELLEKIEKRVDSDAENKLFRVIWNCRKPYVDSYKEALAFLLDQRDYEKGRLQMITVTLPRLIDYHNAWEQFVEFQSEQMKRAGLDGKANFDVAREWTMYLLGASVFLTSAIWMCVTIMLTRRLGVLEWNPPIQQQDGNAPESNAAGS